MVDDLHAIRVIHVLGGLRAIDDGEPEVRVGVDGQPPVLSISRPPYAKLYSVLRAHSFQPVGVEFVSHQDQLNGEMPVDWEVWDIAKGFRLKDTRHEWSNVRSHEARQGNVEVADIAGRVSTYLKLLNIRLRHLSEAYHSTIKARLLGDRPTQAGMFGNMFMEDIEAGIHAFLADAATFRDVLAEACWRLVLKESDSTVTTMATFLKKAKGATEPTASAMLAAGGPGGWIKNLTDLRNEVTHVAPLASSHEHSFCELREEKLAGDSPVPKLHFPMTNPDWSLRTPSSRMVDFSDEGAIKRSVEAYQKFVKNSGDALEYEWRTTAHLVSLAHEIREAAGLHANPPTIKPIGPVTITRG